MLVLPSISRPTIDNAKMRFGEQEPVRGVTTWQGTHRWGELLLGATTPILRGSQPRGAGGSLSHAGGRRAGCRGLTPSRTQAGAGDWGTALFG